ncbi:MAG: rhodanese-like domain-containing protein, partial [Pseudomonadota bacterium]
MTQVHQSPAAGVLATFYCYTPIGNRDAAAQALRSLCQTLMLRGTIIVAHEGLNVSIAGSSKAVETFLSQLRSADADLDVPALGANLRPHVTRWTAAPFGKLKVVTRDRIVTFAGAQDSAPSPLAAPAGTHVAPSDWDDLISRSDVRLVDARKPFEHRIGTFNGAHDPGAHEFAAFKTYIDDVLGVDKAAPVAMFCTGGVRCEAASAYMRAAGFAQVYQLEGGILRYLSERGTDTATWRGACFVFDDRVALTA